MLLHGDICDVFYSYSTVRSLTLNVFYSDDVCDMFYSCRVLQFAVCDVLYNDVDCAL